MDVARAKWSWALVLLCGFVIDSAAIAADDAGTVAAKIVKRSKALRKDGKEDEADKILREAAKSCADRVQQKPDDGHAHFALAQLQVHLDQVEPARLNLERAMQLEPNNSEMYAFKGRFHGIAKEYPAAVKALRRAVELDPKNTDARMLLATCLSNLNETEEALSQAREVVRLEPNDSETIPFLVLMLLKAKKYEEWERTLRAALNMQPKNKELREFFVFGFVAQQKHEKAYRECLELQKLDADNTDLEGRLVVLATQAKQPALAAVHIERLRALRRAGKVTGASFARDDFFVGMKRVVAGENFELKDDAGTSFAFYVLNEKENSEYDLSLVNSAEMDAYLVKLGNLKEAEKAFVLVKSQNGKNDIFEVFLAKPTYEQVRTVVVEVVEGTRQPWQPDRQAAENIAPK